MDTEQILRYQPRIFRDRLEPFPIQWIGCTVFTQKRRSASFPKWEVDPAKEGLAMIIEYAVFYDYDIQHLYDLEHIWVGVDENGQVRDCWCSFHGMRLRAAGVPGFRVEDTHPVLYSQPGKHAMLPDPALFVLHPEFHRACSAEAGGGVLLPALLQGAVRTDEALDKRVSSYIRKQFAFTPSLEFVRQELQPEQLISWPELLEKIPHQLKAQIERILSSQA